MSDKGPTPSPGRAHRELLRQAAERVGTKRDETAIRLPADARQKLKRLAILLAGLGTLAGSSALAHADIRNRPPFLRHLNSLFRLDLDNLPAALASIPFFVIGTVVVLRYTKTPSRWDGAPPTRNSRPRRPPTSSVGGFLIGLAGICLANLAIGTVGYFAGVSWMLIAGLLAMGAALLLWDRERGCEPRLALEKRDAYWMVGLTLLGLLILTYRLENLPRMLVGDEGAFFIDAKRIAAGAEGSSPFGFSTYTFPALGLHTQAAVLRAFGPTLWSWRFASVLPAALTAPALYLLVRQHLDRRTAIGAGLLFVTLPFTLSYSRLGYNSSQVFPYLVLAATFLLLAERQASVTWAFLAGVLAGLGSLTYLSSRIIPVAAIVYFALKAAFDRSNRGQHAVTAALFAAGAILAVSPHLTHGLTGDQASLGLKTSESLLTNVRYVRGFFEREVSRTNLPTVRLMGHEHVLEVGLWLRLIVRGLFRTAAVFFHSDVVRMHFLVGPLAGTAGSLLMLIGLSSMTKVDARQPIQFLTLWFFLGLLGLSALNAFPPQPAHLTGILPLIPIFTSIGLTLVVDGIQQSLPRLGTRGSGALLGAVLIGIAFFGLRAYFQTMPREYKPNIEDAMSWAALENPQREILYLHTDPARTALTPFLIWALPLDAPYQNQYVDPQQSTEISPPQSGEITIFASAADAASARSAVGSQWAGQWQSETITDPGGQARIVILKNGGFPLYPQRTLLGWLLASYWQSPLKWVIACTALLPLAGLLGPDLWRRLRPASVRALIWLTASEKEG